MTIQPPRCQGCGQPVLGTAQNVGDARWWHGECYGLYVAELWKGYAAARGVGSYSHDDRVADGLEYP